MQQTFRCLTRRLFVSGSRSPDSPQPRPYLHQLSKADFRRALKTMGATPAAVLENEAVLSLMLPALQSDMRLAEIWRDWHPTRLAIPLNVYYGHQDSVANLASMAGWSNYTCASCEFFGLDAGHFFLESNREELLDHMTMRMRD
jgi:surfactin synthase thioesterase subunit